MNFIKNNVVVFCVVMITAILFVVFYDNLRSDSYSPYTPSPFEGNNTLVQPDDFPLLPTPPPLPNDFFESDENEGESESSFKGSDERDFSYLYPEIEKRDKIDHHDHYEIAGSRVYYWGVELAGFDAETFEYITDSFARDKDSVWYYDEQISVGVIKKMEGANPDMIQEQLNSYNTYGPVLLFDEDQVWYYWKVGYFVDRIFNELENTRIEGMTTFKMDGRKFQKYQNRLFFNGIEFKGLDLENSELIQPNIISDGINTFYVDYVFWGTVDKLEGLDLNNYKSDWHFVYDDNSVFFRGKRQYDLDAKTIHKYNKWYWGDHDTTYFLKGSCFIDAEQLKLVPADAGTFEVISDLDASVFAKDKNNMYRWGRIINGVNPRDIKIDDKKIFWREGSSEYIEQWPC